MARYGTFTYDDGTKYGTSPTTTDLLWTFIVDWNADGYFTGENEALQMSNLSMGRGRDHFIRPDGEGFEPYRPGRTTVVLDNYDGRYSPFNASSPLYPYVTPGKLARLAVKIGNLGDNYLLMVGTIEDIQPFNEDNHELVRITVVDGQEWLRGRTIKIGASSTPISAENYWTTGRWVDLILERADWPDERWPRDYSNLEDYQAGTFKTIPIAWFWLRDALESIREMEEAEGIGVFLHARDGSARFLERDFSQDKLIFLDENDVLIDLTVPQPWETIRNQIQVRVHQVKLHDLDTTLWQIGGDDDAAIKVEAESVLTVEAEFRYFNYRVVPANAPVILYDFGSTVDGTPDDLDGNVIVTVEDNELADGATIIFQNVGGVDGYIRDLQMWGDAQFAKYNNWITAEDAESIGLYGAKALKLKSEWIQENDDAETVADNLLAVLASPTPYPVIKLLGRPDKQFKVDLYVARIQFDFPKLGISQLFRVGKIEHEWMVRNGQTVMTTLKLEPDLALDAPTTAEYDYFYAFEEDEEGWSLQTDWDYYNEGLRADLSGSVTRTASISGLAAAVAAGSFVSFTYKFSFPQDREDTAVQLQVIFDGGPASVFITIPIEASQEGIQYFYDASGYAGVYSEITGLAFYKLGAAPLDGEFFVDDVGIGVLS